MKFNHKILSRRSLLKKTALLSLGGGLIGTQSQFGLLRSALANSQFSDSKTLVCWFLYGGNDSYNMFLPTQTGLYSRYANLRGNLAIPQSELLLTNDSQYGFNPAMPEAQQLYNNNQLAILANTGILTEPTDATTIQHQGTQLPQELFAHNHQQELWQKSPGFSKQEAIANGWGGRMADLLSGTQSSSEVVNYAIKSNNTWQKNANTSQYGVSASNGISAFKFSSNGVIEQFREQLSQGVDRNNPFQNELEKRQSHAIDSSFLLAPHTQSTNNFDETLFNGFNSDIGDQLKMACRLINAREALGQKRQIIFISSGGWDTHVDQDKVHPQLLSDLSKGMAAFNDAMATLGLADSTTLFTMSDFGRTLTVNGSGTDHGWGGHQLITGGAVQGGQVFGQMPSFSIGAEDDFPLVDTGCAIPSTSDAQYCASLARWMGLNDSQLMEVFPQLSGFGSHWDNPVSFFG